MPFGVAFERAAQATSREDVETVEGRGGGAWAPGQKAWAQSAPSLRVSVTPPKWRPQFLPYSWNAFLLNIQEDSPDIFCAQGHTDDKQMWWGPSGVGVQCGTVSSHRRED